MSRQTALDNIWLRPSSRWAHTEYSLDYNKSYLSGRTGISSNDFNLLAGAYDLFSFDFLWSVNDGIVDWNQAGRTTDMGHASFAADGSDKRMPGKCPFTSMEEVWDFDAVGEYGLPGFDNQVNAYEQFIEWTRKTFPNQLATGGYYKTIVSGAVESFGWDMLLWSASNAKKIEKVFDSFFQRTLFYMKAWAKTSVEVVIQHDDFVWAAGPFMKPDIYRKIIIPRYAELWKPLHEAGKKVLFCSDGNFMDYAPDVAEAGADGFIFEPCNDFGFMADNFGQTKCLAGSFVDCRDLTFGNWDMVQKTMDKTFERLSKCRGAIIAVGNHLPPNIPDGMLDKYFDYLLPRLKYRDNVIRKELDT